MGYTTTIDTTKFKIIEDGKPRRGLVGLEEIKALQSELSPNSKDNLVIGKWNRPITEGQFVMLSDLIKYFSKLQEEHGDLPVLHYIPETDCYIRCLLGMIDITKRFHLAAFGTGHPEMHIYNQKAVILIG